MVEVQTQIPVGNDKPGNDKLSETIVAISTPAGRGGIGIVRLSGGRARELAEAVLRLSSPLEDACARFARVLAEDGKVLDEAVVTYFQAPRSYTSEDVVEIAAHGSPVVLAALLRRLVTGGARLAEAGEFTRRAYLSGRLDLTQAEAVHDLIESETVHQAQVAAAQMGGSVARALAPAKEELLALVAGLEAGVDFAEDDLDLLPAEEILARLADLEQTLAALAGSYGYGRLVREGFKLAIVGRPNVGKSSLFNRLLERERAIVTAQPGTTRDPVSERMTLGGIPLEVTDTAGLRELAARPEHEAEIEGILRSRMTMADADLVLHVVDATAISESGLSEEDRATAAELEGRASLLIANKSDLVGAKRAEAERADVPAVYTSAATGAGVGELRAAILDRLARAPASDSAMISNLRQATAIGVAVEALRRAGKAAGEGVPHEFLLLDLYAAVSALDELTGATTAEDVLRRIFAGFCIGK